MITHWMTLAALIGAALGCAERSVSIDSAETWSLAPTPRLSIGIADGDERYTFREIVGVNLLRDGGVLVADGLPSMAIYDSAGVFVRRWGRKGNGPGEFEVLWTAPFAYRGDSIATWDLVQRRLSVLDPTGGFARATKVIIQTLRTPGTIPEQSCCVVLSALADGSFVLEFPGIIPTEPGPVRSSTITLARISPDGSPIDTLGGFASQRYRYDATARSKVRDLHAGPRFVYAVAGDTVFGGNGDGSWFLRIVPGSPPDTIRFPHAPIPITSAFKEEYANAWRAEFARNPRIFEGQVEELFEGEYAPHVPAYTELLHDPAGALWLRQWAMPFSRDSARFHVYSTGGRPIARLAIPSTSRVADIGRERVALIEADSLDVEYVRVYDIVRRRPE
jgi:hypothetical protein